VQFQSDLMLKSPSIVIQNAIVCACLSEIHPQRGSYKQRTKVRGNGGVLMASLELANSNVRQQPPVQDLSGL
jgi:hypothetical protein